MVQAGRAPFYSLLLATTLAGCQEWLPEGRIEHPIVDSLTLSPKTALVIRRSGPASDSVAAKRLATFRRHFARRQVTATVGTLDGPPEATFGTVLDAKVTDRDEILIADIQTAEVQVFDPSGTFLYTLGRHGEGPGEFKAPAAILLPEPGELLVLDRAQLIHHFRRRAGRYEYVDRVRFNAFHHDVCQVEEGFVVHATIADQPEVLHHFGFDGALRSRFAAPYRYSLRRPREAMSRGQIACAPEAGLVILAIRARNAVEAYRVRGGTVAWHARMEGLNMTQVFETHRGGRTGVSTGIFDEESVHFLEAAAGGNGVPVFVQYSLTFRDDYQERTGRHTVETYVLDPETGAGEFWGDSLPAVLSLTPEHVVFLRRIPFPQLQVAKLPRTP